MFNNDNKEFAALIEDTADFYNKKLSTMQLKMYFDVLAHYPIGEIPERSKGAYLS